MEWKEETDALKQRLLQEEDELKAAGHGAAARFDELKADLKDDEDQEENRVMEW